MQQPYHGWSVPCMAVNAINAAFIRGWQLWQGHLACVMGSEAVFSRRNKLVQHSIYKAVHPWDRCSGSTLQGYSI